MTETASITRLDVARAEKLAAPSVATCDCCGAVFAPRVRRQRFCSTSCRNAYHQFQGHQGTVKRISKTKHGWSWTIHMSDGDWAQLGDTVQLVRR